MSAVRAVHRAEPRYVHVVNDFDLLAGGQVRAVCGLPGYSWLLGPTEHAGRAECPRCHDILAAAEWGQP